MKNYIDKAGKYYRDVVSEMRKVSWPTRDEVKDMTVVVLTVSGILALFTFSVDWVISTVMGKIL
ncbi:preprotein translocase, SecE subunit [Chlorobaculum parvum NCIB 8327]|uniref:Protein translocase subunit SecE n=1 Tax=Chlorobaculum parvum (strain DSM 263 / NCIMB 8327) TaxID=517417 RepID=B3QQS8_CHLP8|nr:preprotein translocase subunit SecE [Chlorobaculum parvum]ACF12281.1 preprotein translocase, SecE subunit [Chlorobaculum parvum NCIB 8327]